MTLFKWLLMGEHTPRLSLAVEDYWSLSLRSEEKDLVDFTTTKLEHLPPGLFQLLCQSYLASCHLRFAAADLNCLSRVVRSVHVTAR
jgi:hypothetical protein